mgnify:CR=1 FL=1
MFDVAGQPVVLVAMGDDHTCESSTTCHQSELALMDAATTFPAPEALTDAEASSLYIGYQTGWFGLHRRAGAACLEAVAALRALGWGSGGLVAVPILAEPRQHGNARPDSQMPGGVGEADP